MRSAGAIAAAGVLAMLLQTTIFPAVPRLPVVPDLVLVLTVYLGMRHHSVGGAAGAFLLGYFLDTFSGTVLGTNAFAMTASYLVVYLVAQRLWTDGGLPVMVMVFFAAGVREAATVFAAMLAESPGPAWQHVVRYGLLEAVLAAVVAPAVFGFVAWQKRLWEPA